MKLPENRSVQSIIDAFKFGSDADVVEALCYVSPNLRRHFLYRLTNHKVEVVEKLLSTRFHPAAIGDIHSLKATLEEKRYDYDLGWCCAVALNDLGDHSLQTMDALFSTISDDKHPYMHLSTIYQDETDRKGETIHEYDEEVLQVTLSILTKHYKRPEFMALIERKTIDQLRSDYEVLYPPLVYRYIIAAASLDVAKVREILRYRLDKIKLLEDYSHQGAFVAASSTALEMWGRADYDTIFAAFTNNWEIQRKRDEPKCFIATAVCDNPNAKEVQVLRMFRDQFLRQRTFGRLFIWTYEAVSPPVATFVARHFYLKKFIKLKVILPFSSLAESILLRHPENR
jgi:hypothetical protein